MERQAEIQRSVLVVEDDPAVRQTITDVLEEEGYVVNTAANGDEALLMLQQPPLPDVILLDLMMPTMNGWELHKHLQEDARLATIPVVVLSAVAGFQQRRGKLDVAAIIAKPINVATLLNAVEQALTPTSNDTYLG
jgi:CheY-like chemotaxis protein